MMMIMIMIIIMTYTGHDKPVHWTGVHSRWRNVHASAQSRTLQVRACQSFIHHLRQGGYVFAGFCLSVCVCVQDNSKSYGRIFLKFRGYVGHGISYKCLNFAGDPAGILDSGSL